MQSLKDTIAAISTPRGIGAIAVVRMSGNKAIDIAEKIFVPAKKEKRIQPGFAHFGNIVDPFFNNSVKKIDQVVLTFFKTPHSYTGEDVIELSCHGGLFVVQEILDLLLRSGARLAEPGEFTLRAFLNGKLDLVQAESIIDLIYAQTQKSLQLSFSQLSGVLSERFHHLKNSLKEKLSLLEIELDFSEEDIEFAGRDDIVKEIEKILQETESLIESFKFGKILREGAHIVITGKPNVGKSSILNRLLQEDRAIVSDIPGTTRDTLEESLNIEGILFKISDTAGLREAQDFIEKEGVKRTERLIRQADIILHVLDVGDNSSNNDFQDLSIRDRQKEMLIFNKIDIKNDQVVNTLENKYTGRDILKISAKTGEGFDILKNELIARVLNDKELPLDCLVSRVRHRDALIKIKEFLINAKDSLHNQLSPEFIALDLRGALNAIGEITGEVTTDDILNDIFSKFCIGK